MKTFFEMNNEERPPMVRCILHAPSSAGLPLDSPTLTNLDCSKWYDLSLERVNEKVFTDRLSVSIQLELSPAFLNDFDEGQNILRKWKERHLNCRLFDVQLVANGEDQDEHEGVSSSNDNRIVMDRDAPVDVIDLYWNSGSQSNNSETSNSVPKKIKLKIRFNFVSCQLPFKQSLHSLDAIFLLRIKVASLSIHKMLHDFSCQVSAFDC